MYTSRVLFFATESNRIRYALHELLTVPPSGGFFIVFFFLFLGWLGLFSLSLGPGATDRRKRSPVFCLLSWLHVRRSSAVTVAVDVRSVSPASVHVMPVNLWAGTGLARHLRLSVVMAVIGES